ncbi:uncharacterized protein LOC120561919 [Perca fluviatilis]|uniref:uncharacterized protein LOC120561919 n=1 Tax=Perca fluviatilis TaxID=8168 RepID=UPI00196492B5|nr:uncharacterized protein LOC120561919 [Perca fluviatilis]
MSGSFPGKSSMVLPKIVPPVPQEQIAHQRQVRIQLHPPVGVHGTNNVPKYTKRHHELPKGKILVQPRVSGLNHRRKPIPRHQRLITLRGRQNKTHQINITAGTDREARAVVIVPDTPPPAMLSTARILASMACIEPARDCSDARMRPESEEPPGTAVSAGWLSAPAALLFAGALAGGSAFLVRFRPRPLATGVATDGAGDRQSPAEERPQAPVKARPSRHRHPEAEDIRSASPK